MLRTRLIVSLLIDSDLHLVNTESFKKRTYIGDPLNAAYIFSNYEVDELMVLDIDASKNKKCISYEFVKALSNFTSVPLAVGGGISKLTQIKDLLSFGVEKVVIGQNIKSDFSFLKEASEKFGSSSITSLINVKKLRNGSYQSFLGTKPIFNRDISKVAYSCQENGAGELVINQIDRDGSLLGFDIDLIAEINSKLEIPTVILGGCGDINHLKEILDATKISGIACSSIFVYANKTKNVLLKYNEIKDQLTQKLELK